MKKKVRIHTQQLFLAAVAILVGAGILTFFYRYSERSRAADRQVEFLFDQSTAQVPPSGTFTIDITAVTADPLSIATVLVQYPSDMLSFSQIQDCGTGFQSFQPTIIPGEGFDTVVVTRFSIASKDQLPTGAFCFARLEFDARAAGQATITLADPTTTVGKWNWEIAGPNHTFEPLVGATSEVSVLVEEITPTPIPGVRIEAQPPQTSVQIGDQVDVHVVLNTADQQIDAVNAIIAYDPSLLEAVSIQEGTVFDTYTKKTIDNTQGRVTIEVLMQQDDGLGIIGPTNSLGTITFRSLKIGTSDIRILCNPPEGIAYPACDPSNESLSQVSAYKQEGEGVLMSVLNSSVVIAPVAPTPTPPILGGPYDVEVEYRVRFQGITAQPKNPGPIDSLVTLMNGNQVVSAQIVPFHYHENGVWSGRAGYNNIPAGSNYLVLIKGPKHLQKKVCVAGPSEITGGTYRCTNGTIPLQNGHNTLDFSSIVLLAGDIPLQNGLIDAVDIAYVRSNLGKQDPDMVARGDLNYDRIVDTQDYALIINALAFKYDEEE